jgi:tight adherence protein B
MELIIAISAFLFILLIIIGGYYLYSRKSNLGSIKTHQRLKTVTLKEKRMQAIDIMLKSRKLSNIRLLDYIFRHIPFLQKIDKILVQSDLRYPLGVFLTTSIFLFIIVFFSLSSLTRNPMLPVLAALMIGIAPLYYILYKKKIRIKKFEKQLPDALDMLSRSLKAGHAFSGGVEMVAEEFDPPIGSEFVKIIEEINFGVSVKDALVNFAERMEVHDLKFLVVAVSIQRESGGDLAAILEKISRLIRERFQLNDRVNTLSAEGRVSAKILTAVPLLLALWFYISQPFYVRILMYDPIGQVLVFFAVFLMIVGMLIMKKMINIKV